jgi:hypothetical protein
LAYVIETEPGRFRMAWKDHVKGKWKRKMAPNSTTKRESERIAGELEHNTFLQLNGLAVRKNETPMTLGELCRWWESERCPAASRDREKSRLKTHVYSRSIASLRLAQFDSSDLSNLLHDMQNGGAAEAA